MYFDLLTWSALIIVGLLLAGFMAMCRLERDSRACGNPLYWESGRRPRHHRGKQGGV